MAFLRSVTQIDVLIIDCLLGEGKKHATHFCMDQMIHLVTELRPRRVFTVGMFCDLEHRAMSDLLKEKLRHLGPDSPTVSMEPAYDGLSIRCQL